MAGKKSDGQKQYYKSRVSYQIPIRLVDPIDYEQTESLRSFYLAEWTKSGQLAYVIKYITDSEPAKSLYIIEPKPPGASLYFEATPSRRTQANPGKEINYLETEGQNLYFKAKVDESGHRIGFDKVRRKIFFKDEYSYWPDGSLKDRILSREDGSISKYHFNQAGQLVEEKTYFDTDAFNLPEKEGVIQHR